MTGLDLLKEEMKRRGLNQAQCDSKVAAVVLDILAETKTAYTDLREAEQKTSELRNEQEKIKDRINRLNMELGDIIRRINNKMTEEWLYAPDYVDNFFDALEACETDKGRDALRAAQMFVNSVTIDSKYDNTAFIIGLASILSQGNVGAIEELKKINKKIPSPVKWGNSI